MKKFKEVFGPKTIETGAVVVVKKRHPVALILSRSDGRSVFIELPSGRLWDYSVSVDNSYAVTEAETERLLGIGKPGSTLTGDDVVFLSTGPSNRALSEALLYVQKRSNSGPSNVKASWEVQS